MADANCSHALERVQGQSRPPVPSKNQPGTLLQQLEILALNAANPWQYESKKARWEAARRTVLQHARRAE